MGAALMMMMRLDRGERKRRGGGRKECRAKDWLKDNERLL
jgi:hypothetical protein